MKNKVNEFGRSMVEILGVLAVISVLSVGGIMGYRFAMDKYRANDIVNEVNMRNRDTWHQYQNKDFPDVEKLDEWSSFTQTGFPIGVYPRSNVLFDVQVDEVPPRVCLQVLNMNLDGPMFIWVPNGETRQIYTGTNPEICRNGSADAVSIVYTTSLETYGQEEGIRGDLKDDRDMPIKYCLSDSDCSACEICGSAYTCESSCPDSKPICHSEKEMCVECELNIDCPTKGSVCSELENECVVPPALCKAGEEYRSLNGACIPCSDINVVKISEDAFELSDLQIKDDTTGVEQCQACTTKQHMVAHDPLTNTSYCSVSCVKGVNYESATEGCIPCRNPDGTPNGTEYVIPKNNKALELCKACGLDWTKYYYEWTCGKTIQCKEGEFLSSAMNLERFKCKSCTLNSNQMLWGWNNPFSSKYTGQDLQNMCENCPEYTNGTWSKRQINGSHCAPVCQQPSDEQASIAACKANPKDTENCKRQFQGSNWQCYSCSTTSSVSIGSDANLKTMCENCGRSALNGYCVIEETCEVGEIKSVDGKCYPCTNNRITVMGEKESGCMANCKKISENDTGFSAVGTIDTRWLHTTSGGTKYCYKKCPAGKWQNSDGQCLDCSQEFVRYVYGVGAIDDAHCGTVCSSGIYKRKILGDKCVFDECPPASDGTIRYRSDGPGDCNRCDQTNPYGGAYGGDGGWITASQCARCNNRVHDGGSRCILIDPGFRGVCNSKNFTLPSDMPSDLKDEVQAYVNGDYDGQKFRDNNGVCHECSTPSAVSSSASQCNMCLGSRTHSGGICSLGGCQSDEFMNAATNCQKCSPATAPSNYISATYLLDDKNTSSCTQCEDKQIMTLGSSGKKYCVPNDCIQTADWQSGVNGSCQACNADNNAREIGIEPIYQSLCRSCGRIAYSKTTTDDKTVWYCSQMPKENYFINSAGKLTACTANDTELPNSQDAENLCRSCGNVSRNVVVHEDGTIWCVKI